MGDARYQPSDLATRTRKFAIRVIRMYQSLPKNGLGEVLGRQVVRSGTSVGAHYREAMRARSRAEFISKIETALQELEETTYWFELIVESEIVTAEKMQSLREEANEITAILCASVKTAKSRAAEEANRKRAKRKSSDIEP